MYAFPQYVEEIDSYIFSKPSAEGVWSPFNIPNSASFIHIICIGAGGGGGNGAQNIAGGAEAPGAGGGSGAASVVLYPTRLLPSTIWLTTGIGGASATAGTRSLVATEPLPTSLTFTNYLLAIGSAGPAGGNASLNVAGSQPTPVTHQFTTGTAPLSSYSLSRKGINGCPAAIELNINSVGFASTQVPTFYFREFVTNGGRGGFVNNKGVTVSREPFFQSPHATTAQNFSYRYPEIGGGNSNGAAGQNGFYSLKPLYFMGGAGGAGGSPSAGNGGNGSYGCGGGGGGGGGSTRGVGGRGGDGIIIINCW